MPVDEGIAKATAEADELFGSMAQVVARAVEKGDTQIDVIKCAQECGLEVDENILAELSVPAFVPVVRFLPWYHWYPWRPLWCYWWRRRYPYYNSYPYWWNSCCNRCC